MLFLPLWMKHGLNGRIGLKQKQKMDFITKDYIENLDAEKDVRLLKRKFKDTFRREHFRILRISTMLLKKAAKADLSFFDIASIMCRSKPKEPSMLEILCSEAEAQMVTDKRNDEEFLAILGVLLEKEAENRRDIFLAF